MALTPMSSELESLTDLIRQRYGDVAKFYFMMEANDIVRVELERFTCEGDGEIEAVHDVLVSAAEGTEIKASTLAVLHSMVNYIETISYVDDEGDRRLKGTARPHIYLPVIEKLLAQTMEIIDHYEGATPT